VRQYLQLVPQESLQFYRMHMPWKDDEYCELHLEGLRRAGIPEESPQLE
jgi:hypothetical protein